MSTFKQLRQRMIDYQLAARGLHDQTVLDAVTLARADLPSLRAHVDGRRRGRDLRPRDGRGKPR